MKANANASIDGKNVFNALKIFLLWELLTSHLINLFDINLIHGLCDDISSDELSNNMSDTQLKICYCADFAEFNSILLV